MVESVSAKNVRNRENIYRRKNILINSIAETVSRPSVLCSFALFGFFLGLRKKRGLNAEDNSNNHLMVSKIMTFSVGYILNMVSRKKNTYSSFYD